LAALVAGAFSIGLPVAAAVADDVTVFAAASLKNALDDVADAWQAATDDAVTLVYAGSSALARQIEAGAPADIFISASVDWMDALDRAGLIRSGSRRDLLRNRLVLIAHGREATAVDLDRDSLTDRLGAARLAMALVDAVPAGVYGKAALTSLGLWEPLAPNVVQAENVRAALALVARGEAGYGIVYATDAVAEDNVTVVATFPVETYPPIVYPAAMTSESSNPAAVAFLAFLSAEAARPLFERQGFTVIE
jgi:molybdate transport system substrate-binding protein